MTEIYDGSICLAKKCSACCTNSQLRLTADEYDFLVEGGTILESRNVTTGLWDVGNAILEPNDGKKAYDMKDSCGYLVNRKCTVYENPRKPEPCSTTQPGGFGCNSCRADQNLKPIVLFWCDGYD